MTILVRRSNLLAPITDTERVNQACQSDADAVTLDLEDGVVETRKAEAVNAAFTPTADLVAHNQRVREVFAGAVAAGTAAVPLDGRMIDVPVDEWAKVVLAMADACVARDAQKRAHGGAGASHECGDMGA
jgi:citrate lyase beta subunit